MKHDIVIKSTENDPGNLASFRRSGFDVHIRVEFSPEQIQDIHHLNGIKAEEYCAMIGEETKRKIVEILIDRLKIKY